jgi:O-antigen/teichoic acid export membrane protein
MSDLKSKALKGVFWTFTQEFSSKIFSFIIQIILARLLMPKDFGLLAMVIVFIGIGTSIMESGFGQSLIRTKKTSESDYSTIFYFNVLVATFVYIAIYCFAPYVSGFYKEDALTSILRVLSLIIIIRSFSLVQRTILTINLDFKTQTIINLISSITSGIVATILAFKGFEVWSLVFMQLTTNSLSALLFWYYGKWQPKLIFDLNRLRYHYSFGYKLMLNTFVNNISNYVFDLIIGKYFTSSLLGIYNRASVFQKFPTMLIGRSLDRVAYPIFSKISNNNDELRMILKKINKLVMYVYTPLIFLFIFKANDIIILLLTEKWLPVAPIFQFLCLGSLFQPIQFYNTNIIKSLGDSALVLKINFLSRLIVIFGIIFVLKYGFYSLIFYQMISMLLVSFCFVLFSGLKIKYHFINQFKDIMPEFLLAVSISFFSYHIANYFSLSSFFSIMLYVFIFLFFYLSLSSMLKLEAYIFFKGLLKNLIKTKIR